MGIAMICSAVSTMLSLLLYYDQECLADTPATIWFENMRAAMETLISNFAFYPIFLVVGYVGFTADKWRRWMVNCHGIQGKLHSIGLVCGTSFTSPPTMEQRKLLYDIYRLGNAVHALTYQSVSPTLSTLGLDEFVDKLNLLTDQELENLWKYERKIRDAVVGLLSNRICILASADNFSVRFQHIFPSVDGLRGITADHHDEFVRDNPNMYNSLTFTVVNVLLSFIVVFYPFTLLVIAPPSFNKALPCFQVATFFGTFLMLFSYRTAFAIITKLRNPFSWTKDRIEVDALMASTDLNLFTQLRLSFTDNEGYIYSDEDKSPKENSMKKNEKIIKDRDSFRKSIDSSGSINDIIGDQPEEEETKDRQSTRHEIGDQRKERYRKSRGINLFGNQEQLVDLSAIREN
mmetsp:Transcript_9414/g.22239  ORF Transcript_9414/g.22239 Transcript_9414/m.22239 type:complete len:404 (+) Transcript_9414:561-1772(+)